MITNEIIFKNNHYIYDEQRDLFTRQIDSTDYLVLLPRVVSSQVPHSAKQMFNFIKYEYSKKNMEMEKVIELNNKACDLQVFFSEFIINLEWYDSGILTFECIFECEDIWFCDSGPSCHYELKFKIKKYLEKYHKNVDEEIDNGIKKYNIKFTS